MKTADNQYLHGQQFYLDLRRTLAHEADIVLKLIRERPLEEARLYTQFWGLLQEAEFALRPVASVLERLEKKTRES